MVVLEGDFNRGILNSKRENKFIARLLDDILMNSANIYEAEEMIKDKINDWNKSTRRNKFITGAGGHHLWIHLERKHDIHNRVAMIYERNTSWEQ